MRRRLPPRRSAGLLSGALLVGLLIPVSTGLAQAVPPDSPPDPSAVFSTAVAFDTSAPLTEIARRPRSQPAPQSLPPERGPVVADRGFGGDGALQATASEASAAAVSAPIANFEGLANTDNPFMVSPPDPVGDVGPNNYVEMVNVVFTVYDKSGNALLPALPLGALWLGFAVPDCMDPSGDPIVVYDQLADRWILTQFSTRGPTYYNCVAVSKTADPVGAYFRYAFSTGRNFPDYPKYAVWPNAYFLSTREFAPDDSFAGVGAYALERSKMIAGDPTARSVMFNVAPGNTPYLPGDGLLPSDLDGSIRPPAGSPNYFVGTQDDEGPYGAPYDAINIWEYRVTWTQAPIATFHRSGQIPVAEFDSAFPCRARNSRACIAQPNTFNRIDILSYRQRPTWRLAYRNFGDHEALVTSQSVEARPGIAGMRWYEIRSPGRQPFVHQQGTYAPDDGVNRWMGSVAMDGSGNMALGYSVSNKTVFPGIRYTGRLASDPLGQMRQGEQVLINGTGSQLGSNRWGDYSSMNVDPTDDCTFWYVNEYIEERGTVTWQTRIGSFRLAGC